MNKDKLNNELIKAAEAGDLQKVKLLVEQGADILTCNYEALQSAIEKRNRVIKYLISKIKEQ